MSLEFEIPEKFRDLMRSKPPKVQAKILQTIQVLASNPRHPSLRAKRLAGTNEYSARVSQGDRLTYILQGNRLVLVANCTHKQVLGR